MDGVIAFMAVFVVLNLMRAVMRWKRRAKSGACLDDSSFEPKDLGYFARHPSEMDGRNPFRPSL